MIYNCLRLTRSSASKRKFANTDNQTIRYGPTVDLWQTGEGCLPERELLVCGWNVNGIRSILRKDKLVPFLEEYQPDWMCINQTKLCYDSFKRQTKKLQFPSNYSQYWNFCKISSGYSGVFVLTPHKPLSVVQDFPGQLLFGQQLSLQGRLLTLQYDNFYLVNVYKPNPGKKLERLNFLTEVYEIAFKEYMVKLLEKKDVVIFGDMNAAHTVYDLARPKQNMGKAGFNDRQRAFFEQITDLGFKDTFRTINPTKKQYTYWYYLKQSRKRNIGWRMDYIFTSKNIKIKDATIYDEVVGSDHCPISALIQLL